MSSEPLTDLLMHYEHDVTSTNEVAVRCNLVQTVKARKTVSATTGT